MESLPLSKQRSIRVTSLNGAFADSYSMVLFWRIAIYPSTSLDLAELVGASGGLYGEFNSIPGLADPFADVCNCSGFYLAVGRFEAIAQWCPTVPSGAATVDLVFFLLVLFCWTLNHRIYYLNLRSMLSRFTSLLSRQVCILTVNDPVSKTPFFSP